MDNFITAQKVCILWYMELYVGVTPVFKIVVWRQFRYHKYI